MNNLIENEITKNAQVFLKTNDSFKKMAFQYFEAHGLPEKFSKLISPRFIQNADQVKKIAGLNVIDSRGVLCFVDGIFDTFNSSLPTGVSTVPLTEPETLNFHDSYDALNAVATISPQHFIIKKNAVIDFPITIIHIVTELGVNKIISPRIAITLEEGSNISIVEVFSSHQNDLFKYTTNSFTSFVIGKNSQLEHVKFLQEAKNSLHIGWTTAILAKDSRFYSTVISQGQLASANNLQINLNAANAETFSNSLFTLAKNETSNIFTTINHKHSHTHSTQLCKGVLKDESFGVFNGNIVVFPDAQEITSSQLNKNLLLSKKAHIETRPQLLVSADDVKCSHGATVGQLSDEEAFYLESRGINKERAKEMLMYGFSQEILHHIKNKQIRNFCEKMLTKK